MEKNNINGVLGESNIPTWALREDEVFSRLVDEIVHGLTAKEEAALV